MSTPPLHFLPIRSKEYFLKWAPGSETTGKDEDDRRNDRLAKQSIDAHKATLGTAVGTALVGLDHPGLRVVGRKK